MSVDNGLLLLDKARRKAMTFYTWHKFKTEGQWLGKNIYFETEHQFRFLGCFSAEG